MQHPDPPTWLTAMTTGLADQGFVFTEDRLDADNFGNYLVSVTRNNLCVRAVLDRGDWRVEVRDRRWSPNLWGLEEWASPHLVRALLEGSFDAERITVAEGASWVVGHLEEIEAGVGARSH